MHGDDPDTLVLGHNWTSDFEPEEYEKMLSVFVPPDAGHVDNDARMLMDDKFDSEGRRSLQIDVATTVDHAADGHMGPVKQQGVCGSCWAYTANSVVEGTVSKKKTVAQGKFVPPVHISEQMIIDCTFDN